MVFCFRYVQIALELKIITYNDIAIFQDKIVKLLFQFIHCLVLAWFTKQVVFFLFSFAVNVVIMYTYLLWYQALWNCITKIINIE